MLFFNHMFLSMFKISNLLNILLLLTFIYLIHHTFHGQYNIHNYLINKFEQKMYEDFRYNLKQDTVAINLDILALWNEDADMIDEIEKRNNPAPREGEIVIKID